MNVPVRIGQVSDIRLGQIAFSPVEALVGKSAISGKADLYDSPAPNCVRLEGQANGSVIASIDYKTLMNVFSGSDENYVHVNGKDVLRPAFDRFHQASARALAAGPRRLEITDVARSTPGA